MKNFKLLISLMALLFAAVQAEAVVSVNGRLLGAFSVSGTKQVYFSQGNLQYNQASDTWRLAPNQTDWMGLNNLEMGNSSFNDWVDLFSWSLGAENNYGATSNYDKTAYYNKDFVDWGGNVIPGSWRTLSNTEWQYLLNNRANANNKWGVAKVEDNLGMILLPDAWTAPEDVTFVPGTIPTSELWGDDDCIEDPVTDDCLHYRVKDDYMPANKFSLAEWQKLEANGAVFLPYAGRRSGGVGNFINKENETVSEEFKKEYYENYQGTYWSSTAGTPSAGSAYYVYTFKYNGGDDYVWGKAVFWTENGRYGQSVRLVSDVPAKVIGDLNDEAAINAFLDEGQTIESLAIERPVKGNMYNTLCLPFDMTAEQIANSSLKDVEIREFAGASVEGETLHLMVSSPVHAVVAGRPYFIKYNSDAPLSQLDFTNVTIQNADLEANKVTFNGVTFRGTFAPFYMAKQDAINLNGGYMFLGVNNNVYWPGQEGHIKPFRAYFIVKVSGAGMPLRKGMPAVLEETDSATGLESIQPSVGSSQKVLRDGQLFIIRDGVWYNAQGIIVK